MAGGNALLPLLILLSTAAAPATRLEREVVVGTTTKPLCSAYLEYTGSARARDRFSSLFRYLDQVRSYYPELRATYVDANSGSGITITGDGPCSLAQTSWASYTAPKKGSSHWFRISKPFEPSVNSPVALAKSRSITQALKVLNPQARDLRSCSMKIALSPTRSAEEDRALHEAVRASRDLYGIPILFVSQTNNLLFVTFHRGCHNKRIIFEALSAAMKMNKDSRVRMIALGEPSERELKEAYGTIM